MPFSTTFRLVGLLQWVIPVVACVWAVRTNKSRPQIVLVSAVSGLLAALLYAILTTQMAVRLGYGLDGLPYILFNVALIGLVMGALAGVGGVLVRSFGPSRKRHA